MKRWHDTLMEILIDPSEAVIYLNTVLEEGDPQMFLVALRNVAEAHGGLRKISKHTRLNRANLHKMLSKHGNPGIQTIAQLLNAFGLRLAIAAQPQRPSLRRAA